jgi:hypothetical protein
MFLYNSPVRPEIIVNRRVDNTSYIKIYDYEKGFFICEVKDYINSQNSFTRSIANVSLIIEDAQVKQIEISRRLDAIKYKYSKLTDRNKNIGSFDLETFKDIDGIIKVYAIGFITNIDYKPQVFYLTDVAQNYNSEILILKCIDAMLVSKYQNFTFYAHNFAGYDFIFIYNIIQKANFEKGFEYYKLVINTREDSILRMTISIITDKSKPIKIHFVDSLNLLTQSLDKLARDFKVKTQKSYFPYTFVKRNTLLYVGATPEINYYPKLNNPDGLIIYNKV